MGVHAAEDTSLAVEIRFTIPVDAGVWAGVDGDEMTTKEVADEVRQHAEALVRSVAKAEGWLAEKDGA